MEGIIEGFLTALTNLNIDALPSSGSGAGVLSGSGSGDAVGSGSGGSDSSGAGLIACNGNGFGDRAGAGAGKTYGFGNDSGSGNIKSINREKIYYINHIPTIIESVRGDYARGSIVNNDMTLTPCYVAKIESSFAHSNTLKDAVREARERAIEKWPIDKRIDMFVTEFPTLSNTLTGSQFFKWHHILTGSCLNGRRDFCKEHNVQMNGERTVGYYLNLASEAYGKDVIKELRKRYE